MQINNRTDQNGRGTFTFSGLLTSAFDASGNPLPGTGFDFADFLLGLPQSSSVRFGNTSTYFRGSSLNGFVQDDWRMRSNFTLNLGLRYEYFPPFHEKYGRTANLDIAPGFTRPVTPGEAGPTRRLPGWRIPTGTTSRRASASRGARQDARWCARLRHLLQRVDLQPVRQPRWRSSRPSPSPLLQHQLGASR